MWARSGPSAEIERQATAKREFETLLLASISMIGKVPSKANVIEDPDGGEPAYWPAGSAVSDGHSGKPVAFRFS